MDVIAMDDRPVHTVVDCGSRDAVHTPLTDEELAANAVRHAAEEQAQADREARHAELLATVAAATDPAVLALAELLGLVAS